MTTPATLADLKADLRTLLGDPSGRRFSDENLGVALAWATREACRARRLTVAYRSATVSANTNLLILADPGLGILRVGWIS